MLTKTNRKSKARSISPISLESYAGRSLVQRTGATLKMAKNYHGIIKKKWLLNLCSITGKELPRRQRLSKEALLSTNMTLIRAKTRYARDLKNRQIWVWLMKKTDFPRYHCRPILRRRRSKYLSKLQHKKSKSLNYKNRKMHVWSSGNRCSINTIWKNFIKSLKVVGEKEFLIVSEATRGAYWAKPIVTKREKVRRAK